MDDIDRAQEHEMRERQFAIERAAALARTALGNRIPTSHQCVDCGSQIEAVRLSYGFCLCAACALENERQERQGGRRR